MGMKKSGVVGGIHMDKTVDSCIAHILRDIDKRREVDLANKNSVRRFNAAMDRIVKNMEYIDAHFSDQFCKLTDLLDHPDQKVVDNCMGIMFRLNNCPVEIKRKIIEIAKQRLNDSSIHGSDKRIISWNIRKWEDELKQYNQ
jgi:hypothetical protein